MRARRSTRWVLVVHGTFKEANSFKGVNREDKAGALKLKENIQNSLQETNQCTQAFYPPQVTFLKQCSLSIQSLHPCLGFFTDIT